MAGGGGSGKTQTVTQTNQPPAYLQPYIEDVAGQATDLYRNKPTQFFPGQTYAGFSPETENALRMATERATGGSTTTRAAADEATRTLRGDYLNSNPFADRQFDLIAGKIRQNLDTAAARGGTGASRSGAFANALASGIGDAATQFYGGQYQNERENQQRALAFAPTVANLEYQDIDALRNVGEQREALEQQRINEEMQRFYAPGELARSDLDRYMAQVMGTNPGGGTMTSSGPNPNYRSPFATAAGGALSGLGLLSSLGGLFGFSDARVKENIVPVGLLDSGFPVYLYNYKGDSEPRLGVMAQDVERTRPDAVVEIGGVKAVDYGKATGVTD